LANSGRHFPKNTKKAPEKGENYRFFSDLGLFSVSQVISGRHFRPQVRLFSISPSNSKTFSCEQANSFSHFRPSPRTAVFIFGRTAVAIFAGARDQP
jgi:hypothetical protein